MSQARRNHRKRKAADARRQGRRWMDTSAMPVPKPVTVCCCNYGSAVSGEWPEFECFRCERHAGSFAQPDEMCRRHRSAKPPVRIQVIVDRPGAKARFVVVDDVR